MTNKDSNLIYEQYNTILLEESILSQIKGVVNKEGLVYVLRMIKSRASYYYKILMKKVRRFITTGTTGMESHDKIAMYIILVIMNIVAIPIDIAFVHTLEKVKPYVERHREALSVFVDEVEREVENVGHSTSKLIDNLKKD